MDDTLLLDYSEDVTLLVPFRSARNKHWAVLLSSLVYLLTTIVATTLTGLAWGLSRASSGIYTYQYYKAETRPLGILAIFIYEPYVRALQGINGASAVLGLGLGILLLTRRSGLAACFPFLGILFLCNENEIAYGLATP